MKNEKILFELAQGGDTCAMIELGNLYYFPKCDFTSALTWYQKALENGNQEALIEIAKVYEQLDLQKAARSMPKGSYTVDYELSDTTIEWYEKALKFYDENYKKNVKYACRAADLLSGEDAFKINFEKAFEYYYYSAHCESDDVMDQLWIRISQARLSKMYGLGLGCKQNQKLSKYYQKKAKINQETYQEIKFYGTKGENYEN